MLLEGPEEVDTTATAVVAFVDVAILVAEEFALLATSSALVGRILTAPVGMEVNELDPPPPPPPQPAAIIVTPKETSINCNFFMAISLIVNSSNHLAILQWIMLLRQV